MSPKRVRRNRFVQNKQRSLLLEDFRGNRYQNLQLNDIASHVVEFATDFYGSKFIQRKLDDATLFRKNAIFREMRPHLLRLMVDTFANFVVQKLFDVGNPEQQQEMIEVIRSNFVYFSMNKYGCRVVQTAIEKMSSFQQMYMVKICTKEDLILLSKDPNGNHVMQMYFRHANFVIQVSHHYLGLLVKFQSTMSEYYFTGLDFWPFERPN